MLGRRPPTSIRPSSSSARGARSIASLRGGAKCLREPRPSRSEVAGAVPGTPRVSSEGAHQYDARDANVRDLETEPEGPQQTPEELFITTSSFTSEAAAYADSVTPRVILVDGRELARLMIDYGVGVASVRRSEVKRIDLESAVLMARSWRGTSPARSVAISRSGRRSSGSRIRLLMPRSGESTPSSSTSSGPTTRRLARTDGREEYDPAD